MAKQQSAHRSRPVERRTTRRSPVSRRAIHIGFAVLGLILLAIYFGEMIVRGSQPRSNDTVAADAISHMSVEWRDAHDGQMPLWTPAVFSGMPSYGSMIYTHVDPPSRLIGFIVGSNLGLRLFVYFAIGGLALYALLIRYGRSPLAAFFASAVYVFTPYFPGLINAGHNNKLWAAALLSLLLLATDYLLRSRSLKAFAAFVLAASWQLWVRHPQVTYYAFMLIGFVVLADVIVERGGWAARIRRFGGDIGLLAGGLAVTLAVVALPYLPMLEYTPHSVRGSESVANTILAEQQEGGADVDRAWEWATAWSMHPKELVTNVIPSFYGLWNDARYNPAGDLRYYAYWGYMPFTQSTHYFGLIPLLLAFLVRPNRRGIVWGCIAFSVVAILIGLGKWFPAIYRPAYEILPYFDKFRVPSMIYMVLPLSVGIIAAWAFDAFVAAEETGHRPATGPRFAREEKIALVLGALVLVGGIAILAVGANGWGWALRDQDQMFPPNLRPMVAEIRGSLIARDTLVAIVLALTVVVGVFLVSRRKLHPITFAGVILVATIADLWRLDFVFLEALPETFAEVSPRRPEAAEIMSADAAGDTLFRIAPIAGFDDGEHYTFDGTNDWARWGFQSVSGYHAAKLRIYDDFMASGAPGHRPVLDMLNVRYLVGPPVASDSALMPLNDGEAIVYRNFAALPRAWWVSKVRRTTDPEGALRAVADIRFAPSREAIVLGGPRLTDIGPAPPTPPRVVSWDFHEITLQATAATPAFLVLSEIYYPEGWTATIDGQPVPIYQTNYVLRGVRVPPGSHTIRFAYESRAYEIGVVVSWVAFILVLAVLIEEIARAEWAKRRRREVAA